MLQSYVERFQSDIRKFGTVLKIIKGLEPVFAFISVSAMLKMFNFSKVRSLILVLITPFRTLEIVLCILW